MRRHLPSAAVALGVLLAVVALAREEASFLSDIDEAEVHTAKGGLGKGGEFGYDAGHHHTAIYIPGLGQDMLLHCLSAYAPSRIVYNLDPPYSAIEGAFAVCSFPHSQDSVLNFKVVGDGKVIWQSGKVQHPWQPIGFSVDISGISKLELVVDTPTGHNGGCYSVWISPTISGFSDKTPKLSATSSGPGGIALSWAQGGTMSVRIERSHDGCTEWKQVAIVPPAVTTFQDTHLFGGTTYYYRAARGTVHRYAPTISASTDASSSGGDPAYLADMTETSTAGGSLSKGDLKFDALAVTILQGLEISHAVSMQEEQAPPMTVAYDLGGKYQTLAGSVVPVVDNAKALITGSKTVRFKVTGDGKVIWRARLTQGTSDPKPFHIPVAGVNHLELSVWGDDDPAHGIWLEPQLLPPSPSAVTGSAAPVH